MILQKIQLPKELRDDVEFMHAFDRVSSMDQMLDEYPEVFFQACHYPEFQNLVTRDMLNQMIEVDPATTAKLFAGSLTERQVMTLFNLLPYYVSTRFLRVCIDDDCKTRLSVNQIWEVVKAAPRCAAKELRDFLTPPQRRWLLTHHKTEVAAYIE